MPQQNMTKYVFFKTSQCKYVTYYINNNNN